MLFIAVMRFLLIFLKSFDKKNEIQRARQACKRCEHRKPIKPYQREFYSWSAEKLTNTKKFYKSKAFYKR